MSASKDGQPLLPLAVEVRYKLAQRGHYDAQTLKREDPEKYRIIVEYLGKGVFSRRDIAKAVGVSFETVVAVALHEQADIRAGKRGTAAQLSLLIAYGLEGLIEKAKKGGLSALEIAILIDKRELLTGGVTERVGHVQEEDPEVAEFKKYGEPRDVTPLVGIGSGAGNILEEGELAALGPGGLGALEDGGLGIGGEEGALIQLLPSGDPIETKGDGMDSESMGDNAQHTDDQ